PGGRLILPRGWDEEEPRLVFACRRSDAFPDRAGFGDAKSNWTIAQRANDFVGGLLARFAVSVLLNTYHESLSLLRDTIARKKANRPVKGLRDLRKLARTGSFDIGIATREIRTFTESLRYSWTITDMKYATEIRGEHPELLAEFRESQKQRASQVEDEVALLLSTVSLTSNVTQTISNVRIQRVFVGLTLVSIGLAAVALLVARAAAN
ncbi:MAG TPA: hypothetical protein VJ837_04945, partial [Candidatus Paceibacterota bacterium]|nr:hypothetical protein [Candidatus Paceibacterota bacterium]